jgi:hypothetical protein
MPAGPEALPREARAAADEYLAALDAALPRIARGIYVTGSAVLGDWQPRRSDLDILTVTERRLTDADIGALEALHAGLPGRPYRDAMYIPAEAVGSAGPEDPVGRYPSAVDGVFHRARYRPDPVLAAHDPGGPLPGDAVAWGALGPGRLHATITTGEIISKTAAADYTATLLPRYGALLARVKAFRLGADGERFTIADGFAGCDLIDAVVNDAAALR